MDLFPRVSAVRRTGTTRIYPGGRRRGWWCPHVADPMVAGAVWSAEEVAKHPGCKSPILRASAAPTE